MAAKAIANDKRKRRMICLAKTPIAPNFHKDFDLDQSIQGMVTYGSSPLSGGNGESGHDRTEIAPRHLFGSDFGRFAERRLLRPRKAAV